MGKMEEKSAKKRRNQNIQETVLAIVEGSLILSTAIIAPNVLQVFDKLGIIGERKKESISRARDRLLVKGLLTKDEKGYLQITDRGRVRLGISNALIRKPKKWDKRWRVLIFDIPEKRRLIRDKVRLKLSETGFVRLQDSVWAYPYECEEFIALLKSELRIGKDLLYMIVDSIENDKHLIEAFDLDSE